MNIQSEVKIDFSSNDPRSVARRNLPSTTPAPAPPATPSPEGGEPRAVLVRRGPGPVQDPETIRTRLLGTKPSPSTEPTGGAASRPKLSDRGAAEPAVPLMDPEGGVDDAFVNSLLNSEEPEVSPLVATAKSPMMARMAQALSQTPQEVAPDDSALTDQLWAAEQKPVREPDGNLTNPTPQTTPIKNPFPAPEPVLTPEEAQAALEGLGSELQDLLADLGGPIEAPVIEEVSPTYAIPTWETKELQGGTTTGDGTGEALPPIEEPPIEKVSEGFTTTLPEFFPEIEPQVLSLPSPVKQKKYEPVLYSATALRLFFNENGAVLLEISGRKAQRVVRTELTPVLKDSMDFIESLTGGKFSSLASVTTLESGTSNHMHRELLRSYSVLFQGLVWDLYELAIPEHKEQSIYFLVPNSQIKAILATKA